LKLVLADIILCLFFYQINKDGEIRTRDHLIIKTLIPCQKISSTQQLKLLNEVSGHDLYYFLVKIKNKKPFVVVTILSNKSI